MIDLAVRKTHSYVGTCSHLDDWESIGSFEVLEHKSETDDEDDPCQPTTITLTLRVESDADPKDIENALHASLSSQGCHHEYDCCGCVSTSVETVARQDDGTWIVTQGASRNY
jgi:hypothetical protein